MNNKLCSLVFYLIKKIPKLNKTEIVKLSYLTDYNFYKYFNTAITGITYKYHDHGPFSTSVYDCIDELKEEHILSQNENISINNQRKYYSFSIIGEYDFEKYLNKQELEILDFVVAEYGNLGYKNLTDVSYKTEPMKNANRGDVLDFSTINKSIEDKILEVKKETSPLNDYLGEPPKFEDSDDFINYQYEIMSN
jgi:uncharacterized phage-associated protein